MALGTLTQLAVGNGTASAVSASFTPTANALLLIYSSARRGSSTNPTAITLSNTGGLTTAAFSPAGQPVYPPSGTTRGRHAGFTAVVGASPSAMTITASSASATAMEIAVYEITGADTTALANNVAPTGVANATTPYTMALPNAPASTSVVVIGAGAVNQGAASTVPGSFTKLRDAGTATGILVAYDAGSAAQSNDISWTGAGGYGGSSIEIAEAGSGTQTLTPSLFTNTQSFFDSPVSPGPVTLTPSLFTNTQTFPAEVTKLFATASLVTNVQGYFTPVLTVGPVTLQPALFTNPQSYPSAVVTPGPKSLLPALYTNLQTFYSPTVSPVTILVPSLFTNTQSFFSPLVSYIVQPNLFTNVNSFFTHVITASYNLQPAKFTNTQTFFGGVVTLGGVALQPALFTNQQTFFNATVSLAGSSGHRDWEGVGFLIDTGWL